MMGSDMRWTTEAPGSNPASCVGCHSCCQSSTSVYLQIQGHLFHDSSQNINFDLKDTRLMFLSKHRLFSVCSPGTGSLPLQSSLQVDLAAVSHIPVGTTSIITPWQMESFPNRPAPKGTFLPCGRDLCSMSIGLSFSQRVTPTKKRSRTWTCPVWQEQETLFSPGAS